MRSGVRWVRDPMKAEVFVELLLAGLPPSERRGLVVAGLAFVAFGMQVRDFLGLPTLPKGSGLALLEQVRARLR